MVNAEIGRVLRASVSGFAIGCRVSQLSTPSFGALVKAQPLEEREEIYGLIYDINIDDDQLIRRLVMAESPRPEAITDQRANRMLPVEMSALAVGYRLNGQIYHGLPPRPPLNLDPVFVCLDAAEVTDFTGRLNYFRLILRAMEKLPIDQLLVAHIQTVCRQRSDGAAWAGRATQELVELLRSNYDLLLPTLEALSEALPALSDEAATE